MNKFSTDIYRIVFFFCFGLTYNYRLKIILNSVLSTFGCFGEYNGQETEKRPGGRCRNWQWN